MKTLASLFVAVLLATPVGPFRRDDPPKKEKCGLIIEVRKLEVCIRKVRNV